MEFLIAFIASTITTLNRLVKGHASCFVGIHFATVVDFVVFLSSSGDPNST